MFDFFCEYVNIIFDRHLYKLMVALSQDGLNLTSSEQTHSTESSSMNSSSASVAWQVNIMNVMSDKVNCCMWVLNKENS